MERGSREVGTAAEPVTALQAQEMLKVVDSWVLAIGELGCC